MRQTTFGWSFLKMASVFGQEAVNLDKNQLFSLGDADFADPQHTQNLEISGRNLFQQAQQDSVFKPGVGDFYLMQNLKNPLAQWNYLADSRLKFIKNSRCWCYFDQENHHLGKGEPIDAIDQQCKILNDNFSCILTESEKVKRPGKDYLPCNPWKVDFKQDISFIADLFNNFDNDEILTGVDNFDWDTFEANIYDRCLKVQKSASSTGSFKDRQNYSKECRAKVCAAYEKMRVFSVTNLKDFVLAYNQKGQNKLHENGFDVGKNCKIKEISNLEGRKRCCGQYPSKRPYVRSKENQCCGNKTYNPFILDCCDREGSVLRHLGQC